MGWNDPIASWNDVWETATRYDRASAERVAADVLASVAERHRGALAAAAAAAKSGGGEARKITMPREVTVDVLAELGPRLEALLPKFYGRRGWAVGNESFGGCLCHAFARRLVREPLAEGVRDGAAWIAEELAAMLECVRAFHAIFTSVAHDPAVADPSARGVRVERAAGEVLDVVIGLTRCNESWYQYAGDGVCWLLEVAGVSLEHAAEWSGASTVGVFSSWIEPSPDARRSYCAQAGVLAMDEGG